MDRDLTLEMLTMEAPMMVNFLLKRSVYTSMASELVGHLESVIGASVSMLTLTQTQSDGNSL